MATHGEEDQRRDGWTVSNDIYMRAIGITKDEVHGRTGWMKIECRSDHTIKWQQLEEEDRMVWYGGQRWSQLSMHVKHPR